MFTVSVQLKDVAEVNFNDGPAAGNWVAPPLVTTVQTLLIGGGAGGGTNDIDPYDTAGTCDIADGAEMNSPGPDVDGALPYNICPLPAGSARRTYTGGPGGSSGQMLIQNTVVTPGTAYTLTVGAGGASRANGGNTIFSDGGVTTVTARGGLATGNCGGIADCNLGGIGSCNGKDTVPQFSCAFPGYTPAPGLDIPAQTGRALTTLRTVTGAPAVIPNMPGQGGNPNGNNGGGASGYEPFLPRVTDDCAVTAAGTAAVAAGAGFCGRYAGAGGGGALGGATAGPGSGGYIRLRW